MKLLSLSIEHLVLPFKDAFHHVAATRSQTDSVLVKAHTEHSIGYGESCPRSYVTNENYQSALSFFQTYHSSILDSVSSIETLQIWISEHQLDIDDNPAAWCAIELALLDSLAKEKKCTVEKLLQLPDLTGTFSYTAVLGDNSLDKFSKLVSQHQSIGFTDYKIKLSGNIEHDKAKCGIVAEKVPIAKMRLDANNLWSEPIEVIKYITALTHDFSALEEPLQVNNYQELSTISQHTGLKIILDESFLRLQQLDHLITTPSMWVINVRISKMGGLLRSLDIVEQAKSLGIPCIVGAQVGETSLLTRAALTLVNGYRDSVIAQEGAYGTHLLQHDIFEPLMMFGSNGEISEKAFTSLDGLGFGLHYHE